NIFEVGWIEWAPTKNVVFDRIELAQRGISLGCCRFAARCRMHIGTSEGVIEKARGRQPRLDSPLACQSEILKAGDGPVDSKFAGKLDRKIALSDIEAMPLEQCLPSKRGEPRAGSLDVIDLGHFSILKFQLHVPSKSSMVCNANAAERVPWF